MLASDCYAFIPKRVQKEIWQSGCSCGLMCTIRYMALDIALFLNFRIMAILLVQRL